MAITCISEFRDVCKGAKDEEGDRQKYHRIVTRPSYGEATVWLCLGMCGSEMCSRGMWAWRGWRSETGVEEAGGGRRPQVRLFWRGAKLVSEPSGRRRRVGLEVVILL